MGIYDSDNEDDEEYEIIMPLVGCQSNGGHYDDEAFVAGIRYGMWVSLLKLSPYSHSSYESPHLVKSLDLLAMNEGYHISVSDLTDDGEWVLVTMTK
jgi:hypothetical protein